MWTDDLVREARTQERDRAHYVKRGYGHRFDASGALSGEIVPGRAPTSVQWIGRSVPPNIVAQCPGPARDLAARVRFAATSVLEGKRRICSGRCSRPQLPSLGDPGNAAHLNAPAGYCWARPRNLPDLTEEVRGECCVGKRHFDCVGFVSWCFWKALGSAFPANLATADVSQWKAFWRTTVPMGGPFQVGDLLFDQGEHHIGVVISPTEVAHSAGYRWGVRCAPISDNIYSDTGGHWASARRPTIRI